MIQSLVGDFDDQFEYEGDVYSVDMSFDNIILFMDLLKDDGVIDIDKVTIGLEILIEEYEQLSDKPIDQQVELFDFIIEEFLGIKASGGEQGESKNIMDFEKDAGLIYASFLFDYKMDLFDEELHWNKFLVLLNNLSDETPFKQALHYRTVKIPNAKKYGEEYRQHVIKMKRYYSLDSEFDGERMLDSIASVFARG